MKSRVKHQPKLLPASVLPLDSQQAVLGVNRVALTAVALEVQPLRYTPAGIPVIQLLLEHESEVIEAKIARQIHFQVTALALGDLALLLADSVPGNFFEIEGFLAPTRKGSQKLVLHLQQARRIQNSGPVVV